MCCDFLFFGSLDHGKKLNDTLSLNDTDCHKKKKKKKKILSSYYCDSILQFIVIFVCLLKTRQWKIVEYTLKRDCIWWVINKNNASHLSTIFQEHTHTQCIFKVPWTMKLSSTKTLNLHMNIIVKCSTKWAEKTLSEIK